MAERIDPEAYRRGIHALESKLPQAFIAQVRLNLAEADREARELIMGEVPTKDGISAAVLDAHRHKVCPVDDCDFKPMSDHGLSVHMSRAHHTIPRTERRRLLGLDPVAPSQKKKQEAKDHFTPPEPTPVPVDDEDTRGVEQRKEERENIWQAVQSAVAEADHAYKVYQDAKSEVMRLVELAYAN